MLSPERCALPVNRKLNFCFRDIQQKNDMKQKNILYFVNHKPQIPASLLLSDFYPNISIRYKIDDHVSPLASTLPFMIGNWKKLKAEKQIQFSERRKQ